MFAGVFVDTNYIICAKCVCNSGAKTLRCRMYVENLPLPVPRKSVFGYMQYNLDRYHVRLLRLLPHALFEMFF